MKRWIVKHITHREIRDLHADLAEAVNSLGVSTVLDIAPPHATDMSRLIDAQYRSMGLSGNPGTKHDLNEYPYPLKDSQFEAVVVSHILEHLDNPLKALAEAYRIASKYIIVSMPLKCRPTSNEMGEIWHYDTYFTYNNPNGKYMPRFLRRRLSRCAARSVTFIIKKKAGNQRKKEVKA